MFKCQMCNSMFPSILLYNKHQILHKNIPHLQIICYFKGCGKQFNRYFNFKKHIFRWHTKDCYKEIDVIYRCKEKNCNACFTSKRDFNSHLYRHIRQSKIGIYCGYPDCFDTTLFKTVNNYTVHICRHHSNMNLCKQYVANDAQKELDLDNCDNRIDTSDNCVAFLEEETLNQFSNNAVDCVRSISQLYLNLITKYFLTERTLQAIIDGLSSIIELSQQHFITTLNDSDLQNDIKTRITDMFQSSHIFLSNIYSSVNGCLRSTYSRNIYFKKFFHIVMPIQINLGFDNNHKPCYYHYIPILNTLEVLLTNSNIRQFCLNSYNNSCNDNVLFDIQSGNIIKNNSFLQGNKNTLQIILYQDAFEVCNPLGASKKKFKLVGLYMILGNLPAYLRSKVEHIQLVFLCYEKYITFFGWEKIIEPLINDLRNLEKNGIVISVANEPINFIGTVVAMLGDNLGSHQIGGFTENFNSSEYFCRFCDLTQSQLQLTYVCKNINRNPDNYNLCVKQAEQTMKIIKGIKQNSPLNKLNHFHVCNPGLPPCIAHDLLEGIIPYDLMYCIKYFVKEGWFNYTFLNSRLQKIKFLNENDYNSIPLINDSCKIRGTASQIKRLLLILPLAIYDSIKNIENDVWLLILCLREICSLTFASALSFGQVALLQEKINEYLLLRLKCFPNIKLRPKHHYISHYPSLTISFGPLKHLWTLRFESKHRYFKNIIKHSQNYKNITKMLSYKHQLLQSQLPQNTYSSLIIADNAEEYIPENFSNNISSVIIDYFYGKRNENFKYIASQITFKDIAYKTNMCICIGKDCYDYFILCKIKYFLINNSYTNVYFLGTTIKVVYNSDFGVYEQFEVKNEDHKIDKNLFVSLICFTCSTSYP